MNGDGIYGVVLNRRRPELHPIQLNDSMGISSFTMEYECDVTPRTSDSYVESEMVSAALRNICHLRAAEHSATTPSKACQHRIRMVASDLKAVLDQGDDIRTILQRLGKTVPKPLLDLLTKMSVVHFAE